MKRITIIKFNGGLGNQMAQYAMMVLLKHKLPYRYYYCDTVEYSQVKMHNGFELKRIFKNIQLKEYGKVRRLIDKLTGNKKIVITQTFSSGYPIDESVFQLDENKKYILNGVWNNYDFDPVIEQLRHDFQFPEITDDKNLKWQNKILSTNSVSIHVRKGDFKTCGRDILGTSFYKAAMDIIKEKVEDPVFYVFSDEDVKELFQDVTDEIHFISGNVGDFAYVDMQLMSMCKHNIVANSTFSWWSAYLNNNPDKTVIWPKMRTNDWETWHMNGWIEL